VILCRNLVPCRGNSLMVSVKRQENINERISFHVYRKRLSNVIMYRIYYFEDVFANEKFSTLFRVKFIPFLNLSCLK